MENRFTWCVYKHTNKINGKVYIGKTSKKPEYRWNNGKGYSGQKHFYNSINKYGWDNFSHEIIKTGLTKEESSALEIELIQKYESTNPDKGYNSTAGGGGMLGWHHTEESLSKIRHSNSVRGVSKETREKMRAIMKAKYADGNTPFKGKHHTEESKKLLSLAHLGKSTGPMKEETKRKISLKHTGMSYGPLSDEHKKKISLKLKGRKHTAEELKKMSINASGDKNVMYGKHGKDNPNSKTVYQYNLDGSFVDKFESAIDASISTGISNSSIGECCKHKFYTVGGYIWRYEGDCDMSLPYTIKKQLMPIYQFSFIGELLDKYINIEEVVKDTGLDKYSILYNCEGKSKSCGGYIWSFNDTIDVKKYNVNKKAKPICQFDLEGRLIDIYSSAKECSNHQNIPVSSIRSSCKGTSNVVNSAYIFLYEDEATDDEILKRINCIKNGRNKKSVLMYSLEGEFQNRFDSVSEAAKEINTSEFNVYANCSEEIHNTNLHIFFYENNFDEERLKERVTINMKTSNNNVDYHGPIKLSDNEIKLLEYYKENPYAKIKDAICFLNVSEKTISRAHRKLKKYNLIQRVGSDKFGYWKVKEKESEGG